MVYQVSLTLCLLMIQGGNSEKGILVNFWGSLLMKDALTEVERDGFQYIDEGEWIDSNIEEGSLLNEYLEKGELEHISVP